MMTPQKKAYEYKRLALSVSEVVAEMLTAARNEEGVTFVAEFDCDWSKIVNIYEVDAGERTTSRVLSFVGDTWNETYWQAQRVVDAFRVAGIRR